MRYACKQRIRSLDGSRYLGNWRGGKRRRRTWKRRKEEAGEEPVYSKQRGSGVSKATAVRRSLFVFNDTVHWAVGGCDGGCDGPSKPETRNLVLGQEGLQTLQARIHNRETCVVDSLRRCFIESPCFLALYPFQALYIFQALYLFFTLF